MKRFFCPFNGADLFRAVKIALFGWVVVLTLVGVPLLVLSETSFREDTGYYFLIAITLGTGLILFVLMLLAAIFYGICEAAKIRNEDVL